MFYLVNKKLQGKIINCVLGELKFDNDGKAAVLNPIEGRLGDIAKSLSCAIEVKDDIECQPPIEDVDFSKMSVKKLKVYAKQRNIDVPSKINREELLKLLS